MDGTGAAVTTSPEERRPRLESNQAHRILRAMRRSMGRRGLVGSTFDHVTREAGVARGAVFYYFGTKERLVLALVREDSELRVETLRRALEPADSADAVLAALAGVFESFVADPCAQALLYEMVASAPRNSELQRALAGLYSRWRETLAELLAEKHRHGVIDLRVEAEGCAAALTALGEGLAIQRVADPGWESAAALRSGMEAARVILGVPLSS